MSSNRYDVKNSFYIQQKLQEQAVKQSKETFEDRLDGLKKYIKAKRVYPALSLAASMIDEMKVYAESFQQRVNSLLNALGMLEKNNGNLSASIREMYDKLVSNIFLAYQTRIEESPYDWHAHISYAESLQRFARAEESIEILNRVASPSDHLAESLRLSAKQAKLAQLMLQLLVNSEKKGVSMQASERHPAAMPIPGFSGIILK